VLVKREGKKRKEKERRERKEEDENKWITMNRKDK
jgi:hypothetical protein